jgi:hypothetical protein
LSTKASIAYGENYHFYEEVFDSDGLHLRLSGSDLEFQAWPSQVTLRIPNEVLKAILDESEKIREFLERENENR